MTNAIDPDHYTHKKIEPIDIIEEYGLDFKKGSVVKYILRCEASGKEQDDLIKIANYAFRAATGQWLPKKVVEDALASTNTRSPSRKRGG
jgi:hypothetical protein